MSAKKEESPVDNESYSESMELFDNIFSPTESAGSSNAAQERSEYPEEEHQETPDVPLPENEGAEQGGSVPEQDIKTVAVKFWQYLQKDSKDTFLDADIKHVSKGIFSFLNQDIVGQKIVLLEDEKLRTANAVARVLKRDRKIRKSKEQKDTIEKVKKFHRYINNPFWKHSTILKKSQKYLDSHSRRISPAVLQGIAELDERLRTYFNGDVLDENILADDIALRKMSVNLGYKQFAVCEKQKQALAKNRMGDVICIQTEPCSGTCPFGACKAHGEEKEFLTQLGDLLTRMGIIKYNAEI